jgi:S1-C subfamily serine protease
MLASALACQAGLVEVIAASKPSIVAVGTFNPTANPRFGFRGTGFVVGDGNHVVTNAHVLPEGGEPGFGTQLQIGVPRGIGRLEGRAASVVTVDRGRDLALLRTEGAPLPALKLGGADPVPEGTAVALMGFPIGGTLGFSIVTHRGIVAALAPGVIPSPTAGRLAERAAAQIREGGFEVYQLDATAYPGNSGGPLIDAGTGQVIGVVNSVLVKATRESALSSPTGITYAVPVRYVHELLRAR